VARAPEQAALAHALAALCLEQYVGWGLAAGSGERGWCGVVRGAGSGRQDEGVACLFGACVSWGAGLRGWLGCGDAVFVSRGALCGRSHTCHSLGSCGPGVPHQHAAMPQHCSAWLDLVLRRCRFWLGATSGTHVFHPVCGRALVRVQERGQCRRRCRNQVRSGVVQRKPHASHPPELQPSGALARGPRAHVAPIAWGQTRARWLAFFVRLQR
jgi:hypothetical protein